MLRVYLITNMVNGKTYVGKTGRSILQRWIDHLSAVESGSQKYFHNAIRKHGFSSFMVEELACAGEEESLQYAERFFIHLYRSNERGHGYNQTCGWERKD